MAKLTKNEAAEAILDILDRTRRGIDPDDIWAVVDDQLKYRHDVRHYADTWDEFNASEVSEGRPKTVWKEFLELLPDDEWPWDIDNEGDEPKYR